MRGWNLKEKALGHVLIRFSKENSNRFLSLAKNMYLTLPGTIRTMYKNTAQLYHIENCRGRMKIWGGGTKVAAVKRKLKILSNYNSFKEVPPQLSFRRCTYI